MDTPEHIKLFPLLADFHDDSLSYVLYHTSEESKRSRWLNEPNSMIGFFPTVYPDELLYSLCARYSDRAQYPNKGAARLELFGSKGAVVIDLPIRINYIISVLPIGHPLNEDGLIENHTLLPFYRPFLSLELEKQIRNEMKNQGKGLPYTGSWLYSKELRLPLWLRFCPLCVIDDRSFFGECYWHRIHQLKGVACCPTHLVYLENSNIRARNRDYLTELVSAEQAVFTTNPRPINLKGYCDQTLFKIACDSVWLLNQPSLAPGLESIYNCFLMIMAEHGFANYREQVPVNCLLKLILDKHSPALLGMIQCGFNAQSASNWPSRLLRDLINNRPQHPLRYLLLMYLFDYTAKTFFERCSRNEFAKPSVKFRPFGKGPWPCLNAAANHYQQPTIQELQLGDRLRYGKPTGKFICKCGFAYVRTGPDSSPEDKFRIGRIISFGQIWEAKLKDLWKDSSLSLSEVGRRLGVDPITIRRHAIRLNLPLSRSDRKTKPLNFKTQLKGKIISSEWEKRQKHCRLKWLSKQSYKQKITLKDLRQMLPREYAWLRRNDFGWLKKHLPRANNCIRLRSSVDWGRRDAEYAAAVRDTALQIKSASSRPIQVTKTAIGRTIGATTLLQQKQNKLPLTAQILSKVIETRGEYAVRRVWWAANLYLQEGLLPLEWQLALRANVYRLLTIPEVKEAVAEAMCEIESKFFSRKAQ